jgi:anaerobic magnesium-protoporphyrin IX monomethyl ester cyclase
MMTNGRFRVLFLYPNLMLQTMYPMAIAVLASVLKRAGYEVDSFDTTFYETEAKTANEYNVEKLQIKPFDARKQRESLKPLERMIPDLREKVESFQPDLIAVSALEDTYHLGLTLLEAIRDYRIPNLVGGVFPTFAPDKVMRESVVDMICIGEGERPLLDLCEALSRGKDHTRIPSLWVRKRDGEVVKNPLGTATDLDSLPIPDYTLFDDARLYFPSRGRLIRMGSVETARGCPYRCSFCNSPAQVDLYKKAGAGSFFRLKSIERVREELLHLRDHLRVEYILFPADTFLAMPDEHLEALSEMYQDIKLPFWCQTRPETLTPERIRTLERMGCLNMAVGIEHGNEAFRREVVRRNYSNELLISSLKLLENSSINVNVNNIVGLPSETRALTWDSIRVNRAIAHVVHTANAFPFVPYHGTPLREVALRQGYIADDTRVEHNMKDTVMNMPQFSRDEIRGVVRTFTMYMRFPESEFPRIAVAERLDDRGDRMFAELREQFITRYFRDGLIGVHGSS